MTEFLDLNDDCLEHIFIFCDIESTVSLSKVCKRLNALVTKVQFPKLKKFNCTIRSYECEENVRKILNCIGKYIETLKICQTSEIFLFYQFLGRVIGDRIRKLSIITPHISDTSLQAIEPILWRLEELQLRIANTDLSDDDLAILTRCPHLKRLHIQWDTTFLQNTATWHRLEELSLGDNEYIVNETFCEFMQNNGQLRKLKIAAFNCDVELKDIATYLANLEQLILFQNYSDLSTETILELQRLTNLRRLILRNIEVNNFEGIVNNATKLYFLNELQLQAEFNQCSDDEIFEPKQENIVMIAIKMPQLEVFGISFCRLKDETILEFLRFADNLREIHIHDCDFILTPDKINAIINARKKIRNRVNPLILFVDFIDDSITDLLRKPDVNAHLKAVPCRRCEIIPVGFFE